MSGGSYDYLCYKMHDAAVRLKHKTQPAYRRAFGELMLSCSKAMKDIEWVDSADMGDGDDKNAIMQCIRFSDVLRCTLEEAKHMSEELRLLIELAETERKLK